MKLGIFLILLLLFRAEIIAEGSETGSSVPQRDSAPGEREIRAMLEAYPSRIDAIGMRQGEWALQMDGRWFYWAEGRLLPAEHRHSWQEFVPIRFYNYEPGPPVQREITEELEDRLRNRMQTFSNDGGARFNEFLDTLYGISSRAEAEQTMKSVEFLGHRTRVHPLLAGPLERVDRSIRRQILVDGETRRFVRDLAQVHGYSWRKIAGTPRRSYHSYGIAVDLMPRTFGSQVGYWRWAVDGGEEEWWRIPMNRRWHVPQPVIDAFEAEGFIWGGKWLSFDNVHFEYRPEIIAIATGSGSSAR